MATAIASALSTGRADLSNVALRNVLVFRDLGAAAIYKIEQPLAFTSDGDKWFVREGSHRSIALALLGEPSIIGVDFESAVLE